VNIDVFGVLLLYKIELLKNYTKIITIEIRSWNIKTNLIKEVPCLDKLMATIRKDNILSLS